MNPVESQKHVVALYRVDSILHTLLKNPASHTRTEPDGDVTIAAGQGAFNHRARCDSAAAVGRYVAELEEAREMRSR
jgi:hypothetical protein